MNDKGIVAEYVAKPSLGRAHAKIVFLAVAHAERRIEDPDGIDQLPPYVHAEADACWNVGIRRRRGFPQRPRRQRGISFPRPGVVLAESRVRADFGVVR